VESLFKQIQDCDDYSEAGGITISDAQTLQTVYTKIFATGIFHSAFRRWNDILTAEQTWNAFKTHFAMAYNQHKQMQGETDATSGYATAAVAQPADEDIAEQPLMPFPTLQQSLHWTAALFQHLLKPIHV
jgi:hypothetical protein